MIRIMKLHPKENARSIVAVQGLIAASITFDRGQHDKAEAMTRKALAEWKELGDEPIGRAMLLNTLGDTLIELERWKEARPIVEEALKLRTEQKVREDGVLAVEIQLARIDEGEGKHAQAVARAKRALDAIEKRFPGRTRDRKLAETILGKKAGKARRRA
jgi:tetratricopeptide (TPR) repeat protein